MNQVLLTPLHSTTTTSAIYLQVTFVLEIRNLFCHAYRADNHKGLQRTWALILSQTSRLGRLYFFLELGCLAMLRDELVVFLYGFLSYKLTIARSVGHFATIYQLRIICINIGYHNTPLCALSANFLSDSVYKLASLASQTHITDTFYTHTKPHFTMVNPHSHQ